MNQYWLHLKKFFAVRKMHLWLMKYLTMILQQWEFSFSCYKATMAIQIQSESNLRASQCSFFEMNNAACSQANFYVRSIELSELFIFTLILALSVLITHLYKLWTIYLVTPIVNTISSNPEIQIIPFTLCSSFK